MNRIVTSIAALAVALALTVAGLPSGSTGDGVDNLAIGSTGCCKQ